jgi:hypothetical protein
VHANATPDVRVNHIPDAEAVMPNHAMNSQATATVVPNRVSADDLLSVLPQRQAIEPKVNIAARPEPATTPEAVKLPVANGGAAPRVVDQVDAPVHSVTKPEAEVVRRVPAEQVNAEMEAAGMQPAWMKDTDVVERIDPAGTQYRQVVSQGQADAWARGKPAAGNWATRDQIPSQSYARNELAIRPEFKSDVSIELTYESTAPHQVRDGVVGPMADSPGGGSQIQFMGDKNLKVVGQRSLPVDADKTRAPSALKNADWMEERVHPGQAAVSAAPFDVNKLTPKDIPTYKSGKFNSWFDARSPEEIGVMYKNEGLRDKIESGLRGAGGKHEFLMVAEAPQWSKWGVRSQQVQEDFAIKISDLNEGGLAKNWTHSTGGKALAPNSKTVHNELQSIIKQSNSLDDFKANMRPWADKWMNGGYEALPPGFQAPSKTTSVDFMEGTGRLDGQLYPAKKLEQLGSYLERRGITLKVGDEFLPPLKAGGFSASEKALILRDNPTSYEVAHELTHFRQYQALGEEAYSAQTRLAKEQHVFDKLESMPKRWENLTVEERSHARWYIDKVGGLW